MPPELRFHLDESIPHPDAIAGALRRAGIDVTTTREVDLRTTEDIAQWQYTQQTGRVLVTCDDDFFRLQEKDPDHAGIVFYAQQSRMISHVIEWLSLMHGALTADEMRGRVEYV